MAMRLSSGTRRSAPSNTSLRFINRTKSTRHLEQDDDSLQFEIPHHHKHMGRKSRSCSPATSKRMEDEADMMHYLNYDAPETWSVKLPAYHALHANKPKHSRKSIHKFRGHPSGVSPAVANSFVVDDSWLVERREPCATIEESSKRRWKRWF